MVLQKADQPERLEPVAHLLRGLDHRREGTSGAGIEIEHQAARHLGLVRLAVPGMELERGDLGHRRQALDAVDLQIGLAVAEHRHQFEQVRRARHGVALEELLAADAVRARG